jgi:hypothetical protein
MKYGEWLFAYKTCLNFIRSLAVARADQLTRAVQWEIHERVMHSILLPNSRKQLLQAQIYVSSIYAQAHNVYCVCGVRAHSYQLRLHMWIAPSGSAHRKEVRSYTVLVTLMRT